jgi:hypothetical protein
MNKKLWLSSLILTLTSFLLLFISHGLPESLVWWQNMLLNLGTGILGSLIIIYLYNRVLDKIQENEKKQRESIAMIQLTVPLKQHFRFLFDMYRCSLKEKPETKFITVEDILEENFYESIKCLDLNKPSPASSIGNIKWYEYIESSCKLFNNVLQEIMNKYAQNLCPQVVKIIEDIRNSAFMITGQNLCTIMNFNPFKNQGVRFPGNFYINSQEMVNEYINLFKALVVYYDQNVSKDKKLKFEENIWKNDFFAIGCSRMEK